MVIAEQSTQKSKCCNG